MGTNLSQDVSQFDFNIPADAYSTNVPNEQLKEKSTVGESEKSPATKAATDSGSETSLDLDELNQHECMTAFLGVMDHMKNKKIEEMRSREAKHHATLVEILGSNDEEEPEKCARCVNQLVEGKQFQCVLCDLIFCDSHRTSTTKCQSCEESYCSDCFEDIDNCASCLSGANELRCCGLEQLTCGEFDCDNCEYYHYKPCGCLSRNDIAEYQYFKGSQRQ